MQPGLADLGLARARFSLEFGRDARASCSLMENPNIAHMQATLGRPPWRESLAVAVAQLPRSLSDPTGCCLGEFVT